jgi:vanillate O-demethylase monooxygenase subunit
LVEYGGLIWIWMGGPTQPERGPPPAIDFVASPAWDRSKGYFLLPGNYVSLHENLLDLTHLSFVHANSFGTPDYAAAPYRSEIHDGHFLIRREVIPTRLPPVWAEPTGLTDLDTAARIATSEFFSPGFHQVTTRFYDNALPETARPVFTIKTAHLPTPETHASTHYFIVHGRDFARNDDRVTQTMHDRLFAAFQEDVEALSLLEGALEHTPAEELYEISVPSDAPSVAMRRYLRKRAMGAERPSANV